MIQLTDPRRGHYILIGALLAGMAAVAPAQTTGAGGSAALGTLEYGADIYYPQGCAHNGSTVVCTFVFVHQAETASVRAGVAGSQLTGIQFVDDGHVPHSPNNAYFVDKYGTRQHVLTLNRGDQGTMLVEFPLVDARVSSGELHLGTQMLAGIPVSAGAAAAVGAPNALAAPNTPGAAPAPVAAAASAPRPGAAQAGAAAQQVGSAGDSTCNTPQLAHTAGCKLNSKIRQAEANTTNTANSIAAPVGAVSDAAKQISSLFSGFRKATPAAAPAQPAAAPQSAPASTQ